MTIHHYFSPCPRGLEGVLAREVGECAATDIREVPGGVHCRGSREVGYAINLRSRVASRVLRRVAQAPYRDEHELYSLARDLRWSQWFGVANTIRVDITAVQSPLKSIDFATLRIKDAICDCFRDETGERPSVDTRSPNVRIAAFLTSGEATLYLDLSGEPLFKRGYRRDAAEAPLRENLAAGMIALAGWDRVEPFFDPMCGGGTIVIEAALIARNIAPGARRSFGFERLADFDARLWGRLRETARKAEQPAGWPLIVGADTSRRALASARANAEAAGVLDSIRFEQQDVLEAAPPAPGGLVVTNPPYGVRMLESGELEAFYPKLGTALKSHFAGWRCHFLTADLRMPKLMRLRESRRTPLFNGPLECRLFEFRMVAGSNRPPPGGG